MKCGRGILHGFGWCGLQIESNKAKQAECPGTCHKAGNEGGDLKEARQEAEGVVNHSVGWLGFL